MANNVCSVIILKVQIGSMCKEMQFVNYIYISDINTWISSLIDYPNLICPIDLILV